MTLAKPHHLSHEPLELTPLPLFHDIVDFIRIILDKLLSHGPHVLMLHMGIWRVCLDNLINVTFVSIENAGKYLFRFRSRYAASFEIVKQACHGLRSD